MTAGELCNRTVYIIRTDESVLAAARLMKKHHVGCLVVVQEQGGERIPIGMVTDRDLVIRGLAGDGGALDTVQVADVMSSELVTARDTEDIHGVRKRMRAHGVRRIPVVDQEDRLQGIIAFDDIIQWLAEEITDLARLVTREQEQEDSA